MSTITRKPNRRSTASFLCRLESSTYHNIYSFHLPGCPGYASLPYIDQEMPWYMQGPRIGPRSEKVQEYEFVHSFPSINAIQYEFQPLTPPLITMPDPFPARLHPK